MTVLPFCIILTRLTLSFLVVKINALKYIITITIKREIAYHIPDKDCSTESLFNAIFKSRDNTSYTYDSSFISDNIAYFSNVHTFTLKKLFNI